MKLLHKVKAQLLTGLGLLFAPLMAFAAPIIEPVAFAAQIADVTTDITAVGTALIGLAVVAMSIKWVKATFF